MKNDWQPSKITDKGWSQSSLNKLEKQTSKIEQTEPMDFSSSQPMSFSSRGFDTSFGRSSTDLARFRTPASKCLISFEWWKNFILITTKIFEKLERGSFCIG